MPRVNLLPWREAQRKQRLKNFGIAAGFALAGVREHVRAKQQSDDEQRRKYELLQQGCVQDKDRNGGRFSVNSVLAFCG